MPNIEDDILARTVGCTEAICSPLSVSLSLFHVSAESACVFTLTLSNHAKQCHFQSTFCPVLLFCWTYVFAEVK